MKRKNLLLIGIILLLLVANVMFSRFSRFSSRVSFDSERFAVADTASIVEVKISNESGDIILSKSGSGWQVNQLHQTDESLRRLLFSILQRVQVKRKTSAKSDRTIQVMVKTQSQVHVFEVFGNPTRTMTFFGQQGEVFEVEIPGYRDFLGSIFELSANQWRNRLVFNGNWRSIQNLTLKYPTEDVSIQFKEAFFEVGGVQRLDSNRVVNYLNQFELFQVNEFINLDDFPKYQEIALKSPIASLSISSIHYATPFRLDFYPIADGDRVQLVKTASNEWAVLDIRRARAILVEKTLFDQKE